MKNKALSEKSPQRCYKQPQRVLQRALPSAGVNKEPSATVNKRALSGVTNSLSGCKQKELFGWFDKFQGHTV